jgi:hypothetical protein
LKDGTRMDKYRKKPVVVEAIQWDGFESTYRKINQWSFGNVQQSLRDRTLIVQTKEGIMKANPMDWIIKGIADEFYPCKPDIFDATYEKVEDAK